MEALVVTLCYSVLRLRRIAAEAIFDILIENQLNASQSVKNGRQLAVFWIHRLNG